MTKKRNLKESVKGRLPDLEGQEVIDCKEPVKLYYDGAECPEYGEPIDDDKEAGDQCDGCGLEFDRG